MIADLPLEVWRGGVAAWDCDEMGHWNVRRYIERLSDGLHALAGVLGVKSDSLHLVRAHIRFLRECRPGQPLVLRAGLLRLSATSAQIYMELQHLAPALAAATFRVEIEHRLATGLRAHDWPQRTHAAAASLMVSLPAHAAARSLNPDAPWPAAQGQNAATLGLQPIARSFVRPQDVDSGGRMRPDVYVGAVSDGFGALSMQWKSDPARDHLAAGIGGAALEYLFDLNEMPPLGARYVVMSGLAGVGDKTRTTVHWLVDADTGRLWGRLASVSAVFDLATRRILSTSPLHRGSLNALVIPGLLPHLISA